ncbi:MAG: transporter, partial [Gillisia sp.]
MKKLYLLVIALLAMTFSQAQDITDATRYSTEMLSGTARFRALSGAFGALGGDLSSLEINPAGSAVFLNSYATVTLDFSNSKNETAYFNGFSSNSNSQAYLNQAGGVFVFNSVDPENDWQKFTLGLNYNQTNNFDDSFIAQGIGNTSIDQYFLQYANGVPLDLLQTRDNETVSDLYKYLGENEGYGAQQAFLGYQGYILNPDSEDPNNTSYTSVVAPGSFDQTYSYISSGVNGKFSINFATAYKDFLYMGLNLNAHFLNYDKSTQLRESNSNSGAGQNTIIFRDNLSTTGNGFSFQLGAIGKVNDH